MWIPRLAWKNIWRNRSRTLITVSAIFFAVILSTVTESLSRGVFDNLVKNIVSFYTGYIQVHRQGYQDEQILDNSFTQSSAIEKKILSTTNISSLTPRLESFALASSDILTKGCMVVGIDPAKENLITRLRDKVTEGKYLETNDRSILIAEALAQKLKLKLNDTIVLIGQGYHGSTAAGKYPIKGILHFGSPALNERILYMPLPLAQELFSADSMITSYIIQIDEESLLQQGATQLKSTLGKDYEVLTWEELLPDIKQHINSDTRGMKVIQGILYLLICFGIFSTLLMMMLERKYEMGMLLAIGMKKSKMILLFISESVMTVLVGCIAGLLASIPLIYYLNKHPFRMGGETAKAYERFGFEAVFPTATDPSILIGQALTVLIIGLVLSLYPVIKVFKLDPVTAMKR